MRSPDRSPGHRRRLFEEARAALDCGDLHRAVKGFRDVLALDDADSNAWFNLGLAYKFRRDWPDAARCFQRARELEPSMEEASWNLGVAATAIRDWGTVRSAWRALGLDPGSGEGPPNLELGPSPIRLTIGEVVWADRVDPCRARLVNVPLPDSGHRWGDVVLHDVVPNGEREAWGRKWSVFDEIQLMEHGEFPTLECDVHAPTADDLAALDSLFGGHDLGAEDWGSSIRWLCETCSLGSPHEHTGNGEVAEVWLPKRTYGFAGPKGEILRRLGEWASAGDGRSFGSLGDTDAQP